MKKLYLIRHAQSQANSQRILASRLPYPLTKEGKEDAERIARELKEITRINRIMTSPLVRAVETAQAFSNQFGLPLEEDIRLAEQELGDYSGMSYDEVKTADRYEPDPLNRWNWIPQGGGESYEMIAQRLLAFFQDLERAPEGNILIVTHAVCFRLIRGILENTLPRYPKAFPNNGEIWNVDFDSVGKEHKITSLLLGKSASFVHNP